jgi:hypothetical protein
MKVWALIVAFFVFYLVGLAIRAAGLFLLIVVIKLFEIDIDSIVISANNLKTLEATGNIFSLVFSAYIARKVYKSIVKTEK